MVYEFDGTKYERLRDMRAARRAKPPDPVRGGTDFTRATRAAGVCERTVTAWRNGRTRSTGPPRAAARGPVPWRHGRARADRRRMPVHGRAHRHRRHAPRRNVADIGGVYGPHRAQQMATHRPRRPKPRKIMPGTRLRDETEAGLDKHWSPEQTGGRLRRGHPDNGSMNACHETIHQAIHVQGKGEPRPQPEHAMRRGHVARRHRGDGQSRRPRFREPMVMAGDRPAEVADRAVPGHREGDPVCGAGNRNATGTLAERTTRFTILLHLPDGHDAEHVHDAITSKTRPPPALPHNSPAWDRGTDPSGYTEEHLDAVAMEPNDRPHKTPDHTKPNEKPPEPTDDTATPTDTINTNCQQRCCDDH